VSEAVTTLLVPDPAELRPAPRLVDRPAVAPTSAAALEAVPAPAAARAGRTISADLLGASLAAADALVVVGAALLVFHGFYEVRHGESGLDLTYAGYGALGALLLLQRLWSVGAYTWRRMLDREAQLRLAFTSWTLAVGLVLGAVFLLHAAGDLSRGWFLGWYASGLAGLLALRLAVPVLARKLAAAGRIARRGLAIVGPRSHLASAAALLEPALPHLRLTCHALDPAEVERGGEPLARALAALRRTLRREGVEGVLVLPLSTRTEPQMRVLQELRELPVDVWYCPAVEPRLANAGATTFGPLPALLVRPQPLSMTEQRIKRAADLVMAGTALLLLSPLLLVVAVAVKLDSPGPIFFRQARFGFNNRPFEMLKFRTMHLADCDPTGARRTVRDDPRVTRVGRFLRRSSLDELPQLWNVLKGDMSIVGPRAHPIEMKIGDRYYHEVVEGYFARHRVRPGITGWAQVHGLRGEVDTLEKARARLEHDLWYVENWSLWLDLRILALTVLRGFGCRNAY
jgi:Undecaprenyl-phosphate glucose phosphotransferase